MDTIIIIKDYDLCEIENSETKTEYNESNKNEHVEIENISETKSIAEIKNVRIPKSIEDNKNIEEIENRKKCSDNIKDTRNFEEIKNMEKNIDEAIGNIEEIKNMEENKEIDSMEENKEIESMEENKEIESMEENKEIESMEENKEIDSVEENKEIDSMEENKEIESMEENKSKTIRNIGEIKNMENTRNTEKIKIAEIKKIENANIEGMDNIKESMKEKCYMMKKNELNEEKKKDIKLKENLNKEKEKLQLLKEKLDRDLRMRNRNDPLFNAWYIPHDYFRFFKFCKNKNKIDLKNKPRYLYVDGVIDCSIPYILNKINRNTNIQILKIGNNNYSRWEKKYIERFCEVNYEKDYKCNKQYICYRTPLSNLFHELILRICSYIEEEDYSMDDIKMIIRLFLHRFYHAIYIHRQTSTFENDRVISYKEAKEISDGLNRDISGEILKLFIGSNDYRKVSFHHSKLNLEFSSSIFIIPHMVHMDEIMNNTSSYINLYMLVQRLFFLGFREMEFENIHYIHVPRDIEIYSAEYLNYITMRITNIYKYHFNCRSFIYDRWREL
nr:structural maintenance of chromosomes protein 2-like [Cherax quadricarinatus]